MEEKNQVEKKLDDLIQYIKESKEYQNCLLAKAKMNQDEKTMELIKEVKDLQKKYIRSNYKEEVKLELDKKMEMLNEIPVFLTYNNNLEVVNEMLAIVNEELNHYFTKKLNKII